jgi:serine/threonine protein kinase
MRSFPLAEYEQRVPIRIGSLSQCFAAQHAGGEEVLLKQLLPAFARVPAIASAWLECAEHNSRLDHPGCSRVLEWGEALGESYLTLPMAAAVPLRELLQAATKAALWPSLEAVVAIAEGALSALAHAHAEFGLSHLDLDPHALLLRKDGSVLLTEFGMWRALPAEAATRERFDRGRVAYLCPELTKSLAGDARSDVFSLGAILYELISKERPFHGATQLVTAMAIAEGRRRPLRELAPQAPELLCDIVETMLASRAPGARRRPRRPRRSQAPPGAARPLRGAGRRRPAPRHHCSGLLQAQRRGCPRRCRRRCCRRPRARRVRRMSLPRTTGWRRRRCSRRAGRLRRWRRPRAAHPALRPHTPRLPRCATGAPHSSTPVPRAPRRPACAARCARQKRRSRQRLARPLRSARSCHPRAWATW